MSEHRASTYTFGTGEPPAKPPRNGEDSIKQAKRPEREHSRLVYGRRCDAEG